MRYFGICHPYLAVLTTAMVCATALLCTCVVTGKSVRVYTTQKETETSKED